MIVCPACKYDLCQKDKVFLCTNNLCSHSKEKNAYNQLLINGIFPDVDLVILSPSNEIICVISSKGALSDSAVYATVWHGENWTFPLFVVTKDEKNIFSSGKSKYIPLLKKAGVKVIISNHLDYDKPTESGKWEGYEWSPGLVRRKMARKRE